MDWGEVADMVTFGEVSAEDADDPADVFVLLAPQNIVGNTIMTNLSDMVRLLPRERMSPSRARLRCRAAAAAGAESPACVTWQRHLLAAAVWHLSGVTAPRHAAARRPEHLRCTVSVALSLSLLPQGCAEAGKQLHIDTSAGRRYSPPVLKLCTSPSGDGQLRRPAVHSSSAAAKQLQRRGANGAVQA